MLKTLISFQHPLFLVGSLPFTYYGLSVVANPKSLDTQKSEICALEKGLVGGGISFEKGLILIIPFFGAGGNFEEEEFLSELEGDM